MRKNDENWKAAAAGVKGGKSIDTFRGKNGEVSGAGGRIGLEWPAPRLPSCTTHHPPPTIPHPSPTPPSSPTQRTNAEARGLGSVDSSRRGTRARCHLTSGGARLSLRREFCRDRGGPLVPLVYWWKFCTYRNRTNEGGMKREAKGRCIRAPEEGGPSEIGERPATTA